MLHSNRWRVVSGLWGEESRCAGGNHHEKRGKERNQPWKEGKGGGFLLFLTRGKVAVRNTREGKGPEWREDWLDCDQGEMFIFDSLHRNMVKARERRMATRRKGGIGLKGGDPDPDGVLSLDAAIERGEKSGLAWWGETPRWGATMLVLPR